MNSHGTENHITGTENATFLSPLRLAPISSMANLGGFVAPAILQSHQPLAVRRMMAKVAVRLAHDPMAMQQFCDRIYQLLSEDMRSQHERARSYSTHRYRKRY